MVPKNVFYHARLFHRRVLNQTAPKQSYSTTPSKNDCPGKEEKSVDQSSSGDGSKKGLVIGVYESSHKFELTPTAAEIDQKSGGKLCRHLNELSCELKLGKAFVVTDLLKDYSGVAIASMGPKDAGFCELEQLDQARENIRWGVGAGVRALQRRGCTRVQVDAPVHADAAAEAATLAAWRFQEYKSCGDRAAETEVSLYGGDERRQHAFQEGAVRAQAQNWARYMSDMPANNMTPVGLAQEAVDVLCPLGVSVEAREGAWLEAQRMHALLAVARGSCHAPLLLDCALTAHPGAPTVLVVAKGVTFDSGGLCLKKGEEMAEMRGSMAGAAVALAAIRTIAELKIPINVCACIPLCENMISGQCMKVGDVVRALNGLSIQIENTDMEGRLMMADALVYGQALHKPALVIDVATLTKGVVLAMGGGAFGAFSNSEAAWGTLQRAGAATGDRPWRLPLWHYYAAQLTDDPAVDLRNQGSGKATPCIGAAFLQRFVCGDWLHLDITGVGRVSHAGAPYLPARRMTGRPARTLALALQHVAEAYQHRSSADVDHKAKKRSGN